MTQDEQKRSVALAAMEYVVEGSVIGVGTGSTANFFIDALAEKKHLIEGAVASSEASLQRLKQHGIPCLTLNAVSRIPVYVDGADQINGILQCIKGGGGALTREKIIAQVADKFVCIADESKTAGVFGEFPLPVEVIPMARSYIAREIVKLGGVPAWREDFITDNGNEIIDIHNLQIQKPIELEQKLNNLPGVVCNGLFALRSADVVLLGSPNGVKTKRL